MAGGSVGLTRGSFSIAAPVYLDSYQNLIGQGRVATTLNLANGADCNIVQCSSDNTHRYDMTVRDMALDGNKANTTAGNGIAIYSAWYTVLRDLDIRNMSGRGIYYGDAGDGGQNPHIENVEICLCEDSGIDIAYGGCTDGSIWNARCYSNGMVTGNNVYIGCSNWQVYSLNASVSPVSRYNVRVDGSEFGVFFYGLIITDTETDANGLVIWAANAWNYGSRVIGGYIYNEAAGANTGYAIYLRYGGTKEVQDALIEGVRINSYGYGVNASGALVQRTRILHNIFQNQDIAPILDTGTNTYARNNTGYIAKGEIRSKGGDLTAGAVNTVAFYWNNPEKQDILVRKVSTDVTTASTDTGACIDIGIADSSSGTNLGTEFFDDLPTDATGVNCANAMQLCEDSTSATDAYVVGLYVTEDSTKLVGTYSIEYQGR